MTHDLIIRGGTVVDGTGAEPRTADVAIDDGVVTEVGDVDGESAHASIDADGLLVTPGFVDIHTHYDGQATWDERMIPSSWHGVTTVVMGNCGVGFAPVRPADHERLIELMEGVEDIPGAVLHEGLAWDWESFPEYLDALDGRPLRHRRRRAGAARRAAPARDGRARRATARPRRPTTSTRWRALAARGDRGRRARLHDVAHAEPPHEHAASSRRRSPPRPTSSSASPRRSARPGTGVLQVVSDFADVDAEFATLPAHGRGVGPAAVVLARCRPRGDSWRRQLELLDAGERRRRRR